MPRRKPTPEVLPTSPVVEWTNLGPAKEQKSWVIVFNDRRYAYAWGTSAEEARASFLRDWAAAIVAVNPAAMYPDQPNPAFYIHPPKVLEKN